MARYALTCALIALASLSISGSTLGGTLQVSAGKSKVVIVELLNGKQRPDGTLRGQFRLLLDDVGTDTGTTEIRPQLGATATVGGQQQQQVAGNDTFTGKKGTLGITLRGVGVAIQNFDPTKLGYDNEFGTWKVAEGTGLYKGWHGGGRWALVGGPTVNNIEWDGTVTH